MKEERYHTLRFRIFRFAESYKVELSHDDPDSQAQTTPLRAGAAIQPPALLSLHALPLKYGQELTRQMFSDEQVKERFLQIESAAQATQSLLRFSLAVEASAQELHSLRWELLRHPVTDDPLATSERILFSRYMSSRDHRPVKLRPRADLTALLVVSAPAPEKLRRLELAPVDFQGEVARVQTALQGMKVRVLGGPGAPVTPEGLIAEMRSGVDIVYLVAHGAFGKSTGTPVLVLQEDTGEARLVKGEDLAEQVAELQQRPRLVVLASCQSAGDGEQVREAQATTVQSTFAARLADAGVPAVLAMQGQISMATVAELMPAFFHELLLDGQIDRALSVARRKVRGRDDVWMPALYMRLTAGCLWYTAGFRGDRGGDDVWRHLITPIRAGKVVPILGPRLLESAHGDSHDTAFRLAGASHFPLDVHEWDDLPRVTQYMRVKESRYNAVTAYKNQLLKDLIEQHRDWLPPEDIPPVNKAPTLGKLLRLVGDHLRKSPSDPHRVLAELPARVYVTTNFDPLLKRALKEQQREPQQLVTRWRYADEPERSDEHPIAEPTYQRPLVYHAFGAFGAHADDTEKSLVMTEDDYFDYLISTSAAKLLPPQVESALVSNSLLFLGFRLTDWHFRVLFRLMMSIPGRERLEDYCHVAVQLDPDMQSMADAAGAKEYLSKYFKEARIDIYWGSVEDFLKALTGELSAAGGIDARAQSTKEEDNEWND